MNTLNFDIIKGEFCDLTKLQENDAEITYKWRNSERSHYLNAGAKNIDEQRVWIKLRPTNELNFLIRLKNGLPVGMLSLIGIDIMNSHAETGRFLIGDEAAVRGLPVAVESMKKVYEIAFDQLFLSRIYGTIAANNILMIKWQKYLGMREEGCLRKHYKIDGVFQDAIMMGMLKEEYKTNFIPRSEVLLHAARKN